MTVAVAFDQRSFISLESIDKQPDKNTGSLSTEFTSYLTKRNMKMFHSTCRSFGDICQWLTLRYCWDG